MVVRLLGSAAGGGVPQWNCGCRQCAAARSGRIRKRTQCSVAVSVDRRRWILINASPDLRSQLLCFPVQPSAGRRQTPIELVLVTDADLDHVLGLFLLRESNSEVWVCASKAIRRALEEGLSLTEVLAQYCGIRWVEVPLEFMPLLYSDGSASGLAYKGIEIQGPGPKYRRSSKISPALSCPRLVYIFRELRTMRSVVIAPGVAVLDPHLLAELHQADAVFFDGTYWSNDDFQKSGIEHPSAAELLQGHLPIFNGSLRTLAEIPANQKIYLHINNTNPILWDDSPERNRLDEFGIKVAADGMEFEL
jgi:pyrroloquinoline quinone biosynthesis protein B